MSFEPDAVLNEHWRENIEKLNGCPGPQHDFMLVDGGTGPDGRPSRRSVWQCRRCGGRLRGGSVWWYCEGIRHAGRREGGA